MSEWNPQTRLSSEAISSRTMDNYIHCLDDNDNNFLRVSAARLRYEVVPRIIKEPSGCRYAPYTLTTGAKSRLMTYSRLPNTLPPPPELEHRLIRPAFPVSAHLEPPSEEVCVSGYAVDGCSGPPGGQDKVGR